MPLKQVMRRKDPHSFFSDVGIEKLFFIKINSIKIIKVKTFQNDRVLII